ncbi:MAG: DUF3619 family protein [Gammaproteobacteria bacterium]|jgi:hypothetical protein
MAEKDDRSLEEGAERLYRQQLDALEPDVRRRLADARRQALAAAQTGSKPRLPLPVLIPAGAAAAVVAGLVIVLGRQPGPEGGYDPLVAADPPVEDMEILLGNEDLELLDDLDFYLWLDDEPEIG